MFSLALPQLAPDVWLRIIIFSLELFLTFCLIGWMRSAQRHVQEPWSFVFKILIYGGLTAMVSAFIEIKYSFNVPRLQLTYPQLVARYGNWYELINNLSASMIEEFGKYMVAVFCVINTRHFHKMSDAIVYLIFIGLGFSLVEDAIFFLSPDVNAPYRLLSFYLHSGTSAIIGYSLGRFKFGLTNYAELARALAGAILLHMLYNMAATLNDPPLSFYLTLAIIIYISLQLFILFRKALEEEYKLEHQLRRQPASRLLNLAKKS